MINAWFLELVRCPQNGSRLSLADDALVARLNEAIAAGQVVDATEQQVTRVVDGGLVDQELNRLYPIRDGIPSLVAADSIGLRSNKIVQEVV